MEQTLGAMYLGNRTTRFRVWAPEKKQIEVHLFEPDRLVEMQPQAFGYHEAILTDVEPGSRYLYRLPHEKERPDPASRLQPLGVHGPSEVIDPQTLIPDPSWAGVPLGDYVIYEIHVGTFTPERTFDAVIPRLAELKALGITALELMPIAQFPGTRNWGYDGVYLFAAQESYGGPLALRRLVDACHRHGLAIILDVVYNHLGPEGNYLADFAPYFTRRHRTEWGEALNFDGPHSDEVRRFFLENAHYWLHVLQFDALRLDATPAIQDQTARHFLEELAEQVESAAIDRPRYLIAEHLVNDPKIVRPRAQFGHGLDAHWCDDFHHALHARLISERGGYYADFGSLEPLARTLRQGYHFTGQYCQYRHRRFGREPAPTRADQIVIYAQNHDQVGNRLDGERFSTLLPFEALKLSAGVLLMSANLPLLFMGEEYGEKAPFNYFISHGDTHLIEGVRRGRLHDYAIFGWKGKVYDPQDETTFLRSQLNWEQRLERPGLLLREFYRELLALRRSHPALANRDWQHLEVVTFGEDVLLLRRGPATHQLCVILHFGSEPNVPPSAMPKIEGRILLDSAEQRWQGPGSLWPRELQPWQMIVIEIL